jgi:outer membrane immunogenic protein
MERLLLGTAVSLAMVAAASAADWTPAPVKAPAYSWTGFYLGGSAGMRATIADPSVTSATDTISSGTIDLIALNCVGVAMPCPSANQLNHVAPRFGVYGGYNWQLSQWVVVGLEGDFGYANKAGTEYGVFYPGDAPFFASGAAFFGATPTGDASFAVRTKWDASVRARGGVLVAPNVLVYGTGGLSWLRAEATSTCPTINSGVFNQQVCGPATTFIPQGFSPAVITDATTRWGLTVGGGLEAAAWGNWLLRSEYRYANYGTWANSDTRTCVNCNFGFGGLNILTVGSQVKLQTHTAMVGLAYKF